MLIEVKVKVKRIIDEKPKKRQETYLTNKDFFSEAEYQVVAILSEEQQSHLVEEYEIVSLKQSSIKEIANQFTGETTFIASLKDVFTDDEGNEKALKYKVLLWANSLTEALENTNTLARQGYDMQVESLKEVGYVYLNDEANGTGSGENTGGSEEIPGE